MIKKEDWEIALKQYENLFVNASINIEGYKKMMDLCKVKIEEFGDEESEDKMPEDLKETLKEISK